MRPLQRCCLLLLTHLLLVASHCVTTDLGCFFDAAKARVLSHQQRLAADVQERQHCAQRCADLKFSLAGMEDGAQCYCDNGLAVSGSKKQRLKESESDLSLADIYLDRGKKGP